MDIKWSETQIHNADGKPAPGWRWWAMIEPAMYPEGWVEYTVSLSHTEGTHLNVTNVAPGPNTAKQEINDWLDGNSHLWRASK